MRLLKNIVVGLLVLAIVFVGIAFFLPSDVGVSRSVVVDAPPEKVFAQVNSLQAFHKWSPWSKIDPNMKVEFSGPDAGEGNKMTWSSKNANVGKGSQVITASIENKYVSTALDFGAMGKATAAFDLAAQGQGTRVTWSFHTRLGSNPFERWAGLMFDKWIGADYEKGLANLKGVVEQ